MKRLVVLLGLALLALGVWAMVTSVGGDAVPVGSAWVDGATSETSGIGIGSQSAHKEGVTELADADGSASLDEAAMETPGIAIGSRAADEERVTGFAGVDLERGVVAAAADEGKRFVRILVTEKVTEFPVPGAAVSWYEVSRTRPLESSEPGLYRNLLSDKEKLTRRYGTEDFANDVGLVTIPVERHVLATGRRGELYGELDIRTDRATDVRGEYELELVRPFPEVVVILAGGSPRLPECHALVVSLDAKELQVDGAGFNTGLFGEPIETRPPRNTTRAVDETGAVRLPVGRNGTHTVTVSLRSDFTPRWIQVRDTLPAEVEVRIGLGEQVFEIGIPEDALTAAIEELRVR